MDSDNDGYSDGYEFNRGSDPTSNTSKPTTDDDGDGLSNQEEIRWGSDPNLTDSDGDGLKDGDEVNLFHTDPSISDTNGDGIPDGDGDTDGDTFIDRLDPLPFDFNFMDGDINADSTVDMADALLAMRIATDQITPDTLQLQHGDVVPTPIPDGIIDIADALIIMRKAMGLIALNMNAIEQGLEEYANEHKDQQELIAELKTKIHEHRQEILLILANLNDKIITKTGDAPERPITQSMSTTSRKGILVASIGDLTGLLNGSYENIYYFINDHLGTPQIMTDQNAIVVWQADYDPFGKATVNDDPDGNGVHVTNNIRFPGQYFDSETGLNYNYHRYYDPGIGRYLQPDPIGLFGSLNIFSYSENNPIQFTDPFGLTIWICNRKAERIIGAFGGNHAYLWDDTGRNPPCGMRSSSGSGGTSSPSDKGPMEGGQCVMVKGSPGVEDDIMKCCENTANKGMWFPIINDCHEAADDCITGAGLKNPGAPGGRVGNIGNIGNGGDTCCNK